MGSGARGWPMPQRPLWAPAATPRGPWIQPRGPTPHVLTKQPPGGRQWPGDDAAPWPAHQPLTSAGQKRYQRWGRRVRLKLHFPTRPQGNSNKTNWVGREARNPQDRSRAPSGHPGPGRPPSRQVAAAQNGLQSKWSRAPWAPRPGRTFTLHPVGQWASGQAVPHAEVGGHQALLAPPSRFPAPGSCSGPGLLELPWCLTDTSRLLCNHQPAVPIPTFCLDRPKPDVAADPQGRPCRENVLGFRNPIIRFYFQS